MALRYSAEFLLHLRQSPLCVRPENLAPTGEWMGATLEQLRAQQNAAKTTTDRTQRAADSNNAPTDQPNRRQATERQNVSRGNPNPEDIVFGPPRMAFSSARGNKSLDGDKSLSQPDGQGRAGLRNRSGDMDGDRLRDGRSSLRRSDADQDSEGWSTVKPRKSFGAEGAERFHGKMGAMGGSFRDERRPPRDREERDSARDRPARAFDSFTRDKEATPDTESRPRNGVGRSKLDTWRSGGEAKEPPPSSEKRDRDRTKSWRDRDKDAEPSDDRGSGRAADRRWGRDRDQRVEREPEWFDEPQVEQREAHTQQDFQKWMEQMKAAKGGASTTAPAKPAPTVAEVAEPAKPPAPSPAVEAGPDKFFMAFGGSAASLPVGSPPDQQESAATAPKAKAAGKPSRFTSFFSQPQADGRASSQGSAPFAAPPPNGLVAALTPGPGQPPAPEEERQAFQQLLAKLQKQSLSATPPGPSPFAAPPQANPMENVRKAALTSPDPFQRYGGEGHDGPMGRPPSQQPREILAPRPQPQSARPDQLLTDLVGHHHRVSSQGSGRADPTAARNNSNTEFLMNLMRPGLASQQLEQHARMPQPQKLGQMTPYNERELDYPGVENRNAQRQVRPQPPPGFPMDEAFHVADQEPRQSQPPQILQRPPPPPGLNQMPPEWMQRGQMPPPPQQGRGPMGPPPGLAGEPNRSMPVPHMFPPNFPPGAMPPPPPPPPPEALGGMPPRNMHPMPPPGFFGGPPPQGFMPPGLGGFNGPPVPEPHAFGGSPFEGRGMPPAGNRGASYGRP